MHQQKTTGRGSFSGNLGFILAAIGSAIGMGNPIRSDQVKYPSGM